jgi:hypothetical protein
MTLRMAAITRSAKYGHKWTRDDLLAYISVVNEDFDTFSGYPNMPPSTVDPMKQCLPARPNLLAYSFAI